MQTLSLAFFGCLLLSLQLAHSEDTPRLPNVILVMTDDQGYGDLSCHGNPILKTPNIDQFYRESVRFTEFHNSPTCAPTRSALLTGRHEFRNGVTHTILERERLTLKATTFPQVLKSSGYTTGIFGKWHLGDEAPYQPDQRGFAECFIHGAGGIGQTYPGSCGDAPGNSYFNPAILHNRVFEKTEGYCTDVFFAQAIDWMDRQRKLPQPFFALITPNAPHGPLDVPVKYEELYTGKVPTPVGKFFGMIANIDENFGKLMAKLQEWGIDRETVVIFMTDNGGTAGTQVFNAGMRGGKGTPYRGATRVPSIWRWTGHFPANEDRTQLTAHLDVFPTLIEITNSKMPEDLQMEGRSLLSIIQNKDAPWADRTLFTHVGRWEKGQAARSKYSRCSARNTRFQLVNSDPRKENWELFDIQVDPGQAKNVLKEFPDVAADLKQQIDSWWESVLPEMVNEEVAGPRVNPFKELYWKQFGPNTSQ